MTPGLLTRLPAFGRRPVRRRDRRSRRHLARASLAAGFLAMLAATAGMSTSIETVKPQWRDPEYGYRLARLRQLAEEAPDRPLVLILGTSRAQNAFAPRAMGFAGEAGAPCAFNFGQSAAPPLRVLLNLNRLLDEGIRPAAVVVEVLPAWLSANGSAEDQLREAAPRFSAGDLRRLAPYCADPNALRNRWAAARIAPWSAQRIVLMSHWAPRWLPWSERIDPQWNGMEPDGFVPFPNQFATPEFRVEATARARREYAAAFAGFRAGDASLRALADLIKRCRANGIAVAFAIPPVSPVFRSWFRPGVLQDGEAALRSFASNHGVEVFPTFEELEESAFVDGHHLLQSGAEKYSCWLARTHLTPWILTWRAQSR